MLARCQKGCLKSSTAHTRLLRVSFRRSRQRYVQLDGAGHEIVLHLRSEIPARRQPRQGPHGGEDRHESHQDHSDGKHQDHSDGKQQWGAVVARKA